MKVGQAGPILVSVDEGKDPSGVKTGEDVSSCGTN